MRVKIITKSGIIPTYATEQSSGVDLRAYLDESIRLEPMQRILVSTGTFVEIPKGYEGQVRARSGLAIKNGITLINGIGTIDSDYRGELLVPLVNLGSETFIINNGDRIAQLVIIKYEQVEFEVVDKMSNSKRGVQGFGHTGV